MTAFSCDEAVKEFLVESHENLDQLDRDFVALEADPTAKQRIAGIFRTVHTIKGTSGFLGFSKLESLTHAGEHLLTKVRDGVLVLTPEATSALLALVDRVRAFLRHIEATGQEGTEDCTALAERLTKIANAEAIAITPVVTLAPAPTIVEARPVSVAPMSVQPTSKRAPSKRPSARPSSRPKSRAPTEAVQGGVSDNNVRVDVGLLDRLMNLVGELVLARNQILQFGTTVEDVPFTSASQRLNLITTELQEGVMKTRMQPIGNVWNKLPRVVRDLAIACGKQVRIEMVGKETDLDRTIIEAIKDPLTHIVRNAVDHGIELPDVRAAAGKPRTGTLTLRAFHEGGQVNIEISDDGSGVDANAVRQKAIASGVVSAERVARMTDRELYQLVFLPGFSTAKQVTNVSGRGVGMDVVKTNIEKIGGTVDLQSQFGVGTKLKIKIPLTLAIVPALIVTSGGQRFAIPQVSLLELVRLEGEQVAASVENIHGAPVYRLRGNLLPLVYLHSTLNLPKSGGDEAAINIVVLQADERQFGLVVDGVNDTEEIVVKPLGKELKGLSVFAGATIMGDGKVALILDVLGIAQRSNVVSGVRDRNMLDERKDATKVDDHKRAVLLFGVRDEGCMAIPLSMVARLEEFTIDRLERSSGRWVVQYRDRILPLIDVCGVLAGPRDAATPLQVVVYSEQGRSVGLVVDRILDIVEESLTEEHGSAVIAGKVTDMLDVHGVIRHSDPEFFERAAG